MNNTKFQKHEKMRNLLINLQKDVRNTPKVDWHLVYKKEMRISHFKERSFNAEFGDRPLLLLSFVYHKFLSANNISEAHFLYFLNWVRLYDTFDELAGKWDVDTKKFQSKVIIILNILYEGLKYVVFDLLILEEKIYFNNTLIIGAVDTTECPQERPKNSNQERKILYSGKQKDFTLKWEICCSIGYGFILQISPAYGNSKLYF